MPLRIAHRGMPRRIHENTLASFALALDSGADGIELDVHATRDGVVVVHHDPVLSTGEAITALTLADLRGHEAAPGHPVPTLAETFALVAGRATLFVEIKGAHIETLVADALAGYAGDAAVHSFDHEAIRRLGAAGFPRRLGVLFEQGIERVERVMGDTGALDVWPHYPLVTPALVDRVHALGGRVIPWTVNDPAAARDLALAGVDGLCGDDVTILPA